TQRLSRPERRERVAELLAMVGLPDAGHKFPSQLSGGQQQRVALARALAMSPALLLLDEPLSALDARVRVRLRREIRALQQSFGLTTIMVTHDQEEALTMADEIVVMDHGCIVQIGSPREIYEKPAHPFVADFVGHMNFIRGWRLDGDRMLLRGDLRLRCDDARMCGSKENLTLAVRPEEVALTANNASEPTGAPDSARVSLPATVNAVEFRGSVTRYYLSLSGSDASGSSDRRDDLTVDVTPQEATRLGIHRDQRVFTSLHADRVHVFAEAAEA
ncbi:MAG: ATP-binding cassette domain-containing protein, partial [Rhodospirillales bacterium]|nr:ATP-binding cassette domain-containing protein [Rhodospirillales bacterium]